MHPEQVENRYKYVTNQLCWDFKLIARKLDVEVYMNV